MIDNQNNRNTDEELNSVVKESLCVDNNRTLKYLGSSNEIKSKVDSVLSILYGMPLNEVLDVLRLSTSQIQATINELTSVFKFTHPDG